MCGFFLRFFFWSFVRSSYVTVSAQLLEMWQSECDEREREKYKIKSRLAHNVLVRTAYTPRRYRYIYIYILHWKCTQVHSATNQIHCLRSNKYFFSLSSVCCLLLFDGCVSAHCAVCAMCVYQFLSLYSIDSKYVPTSTLNTFTTYLSINFWELKVCAFASARCPFYLFTFHILQFFFSPLFD